MPESPTRAPVDLAMLLNQSGYALSALLGSRLEALGISTRVYCVLLKAAEGEHTQTRLAELAWLDKTTMVVTMDELEARGLAVRRPSPADRRVRVIGLTDEGREVLGRARTIVAGVYDELLGAVPAHERAAFVAVLTRLVEGPLAAPFHLERPVRRRRQRAA